jgi:hypothetical protein
MEYVVSEKALWRTDTNENRHSPTHIPSNLKSSIQIRDYLIEHWEHKRETYVCDIVNGSEFILKFTPDAKPGDRNTWRVKIYPKFMAPARLRNK